MTARHSAEKFVDEYLQLCEDRQLEKASEFLASGVDIVFPGNRKYTNLQQMAAASVRRYSWVRKNRTHYSLGERVAADGQVEQIVTSAGTLYGEKLDGTPFADIRYIDVFTLRDGLIARQEVWNDLSENGIVQISEGK
jgi:hypothetical protein